ncbi:acetyl-CoA carboxylase biotin carboxyl carrier protein [Nocardia macrotermitis]|uniref:Biotin carboxyl carrier protein of acetyl-CoA carboxylase n=1 Tax=Nocardia macrotermitis TaxID=2585198 RepID=A0A7K0CVZ7_9NOCA|nr:biotin/lipoyl-containing protein [Nocardia macrotermitis]MQY17152.1 hypothetical protein [Nocardia macrotermitis]
MTDTVTTETIGRAVDATAADRTLTVLTRHALGVRSASTATSVTVANGPVSLRISWDADTATEPNATPPAGTVPQPALATAEPAHVETTSPADTFTITTETVGVFYRATEPGADPFVSEGDPVRVGQQVGIVEAMKLMIPVIAEQEGRVVRFLAENGDAVEHGQGLLVLEVVR